MTRPNGGRMCQRHDAIRNWLAEECRDRCHLKVKLEVPWTQTPPVGAPAPVPPAGASMPSSVS
eukprot:8282700-Prorocentrum_lima.AAC.1